MTAKLCIDNNDGDNTQSCKSQRASDNIDHHNTDNHKDGGNGHHSKDDTPFSLPFP